MSTNKPKNSAQKLIADNRKATYDYFIEERFEAGIVLEGWEVKSLRAGRAQLKESYVTLRNNEVWLLGAHISPLGTSSTHINPDATRSRKLLLHRKQIDKLIGAIDRKGYTLVPLKLYFDNNRIKTEIGLAKGKKAADKRDTEKERDWKREQARIVRNRR